jgi:hypothetical protein
VVTLHAFLALLAGYITMSAIVIAATALIARLTPSWVGDPANPDLGYIFVNLGYSFLGAAAGGYLTAAIGRENPWMHTVVLAVVVLVLAALNALLVRGKKPMLYQLALVGLTPIGVLVGGLVRLRILGIL